MGHDYAYTYDGAGNRTGAIVDGTTGQSLTFNAVNEISSTGYTYDAAEGSNPSPVTTRKTGR